MILKKLGKLVFNSFLMAMLLGFMVLPIGSMGLINLAKQDPNNTGTGLPSLNSEVLSAQDEKKKIQNISKSTQTKETTQSTKSNILTNGRN